MRLLRKSRFLRSKFTCVTDKNKKASQNDIEHLKGFYNVEHCSVLYSRLLYNNGKISLSAGVEQQTVRGILFIKNTDKLIVGL